MNIDTKQISSSRKVQIPGVVARTGRFLWHFVQMVIAMMVGMGVYHLLTGKTLAAYPVLFYAGMELSMIPPMVALMLYQHHGWRCTVEMAVAMLVGPALFLTCAQLGLHNYIPGFSRNTLFVLSDATMYLGMLGAMLYRREMYTRPHAGHPHSWTASVRPLLQRAMRSRARHFIQHFFEMCVTMCLGLGLVSALIEAAIPIDRSDLRSQYPWLMGLIYAVSMVIPMAAWMLYRKMGQRHTRDMSIACLIGAMLPIAAGQLGFIPMSIAFPLQCGISCIAMLFPMIQEQFSLAKERATVHSNPIEATSSTLTPGIAVEETLAANGAAAVDAVQVTEVSFGVTGMTCTSCAATIERNLQKLPGVQVAKVNFASERGTVTFDSD